MSEQSSEIVVVSHTVEAARMLREISPPGEHQNVKSRIGKAARKLGWSASRVKDIWYGDGRVRLRADEFSKLREASAAKDREIANQSFELDALASRLEAIDPQFYGAEVARLRDMACRLRGQPVGQVGP